MSILVVAFALICFVVLVTVLFIAVEKRKTDARMNQFINRLKELGSLNNLEFTSQEMLKGIAIGLDGRQRKVLVLMGNHETTFSYRLFNVNDVAICEVKHEYNTVNLGLKNDKTDRDLEKIILRFEMKGTQESVEVDFYNIRTSDVYEIKESAEKAKRWEALLAEMLKERSKKAARLNNISVRLLIM